MDGINKNRIIQRKAIGLVESNLEPGKVVVLYGPRRVGKTTILNQLKQMLPQEKILYLQGEDAIVQKELASRNAKQYEALRGQATLVIIDEAQAVEDIGDILKLWIDTAPDLKIIASGSASFDLAQKVGEPLTGRKKTVTMYPLWAGELIAEFGLIGFKGMHEELLVYGSYPELFQLSSREEKAQYLKELISAYLYKDILALEQVRNPKIIRDLLTLIAFQVGKEVSLSELAASLGVAKKTIVRYLDLLEQSFVLLNNPLGLRDDVGQLWENWLVMERIKKQGYEGIGANNYFWRTYDQKEIDWVEERGGKLYAYEISWKQKDVRKSVSKEFTRAYPESTIQNINSEKYLDFIR
jgi:predicted AAA+ superfamily ATPase